MAGVVKVTIGSFNNILFYCDTDGNNNITEFLAGYAIIPNRQYEYFFMIQNEDIANNPQNYTVIDNETGKRIELK